MDDVPVAVIVLHVKADDAKRCRVGERPAELLVSGSRRDRVAECVEEIARFVGKRTVYSFADIQDLCEKDALAILFRQSIAFTDPLPLKALIAGRVLIAAPQSIVRINEEGIGWMTYRITA